MISCAHVTSVASTNMNKQKKPGGVLILGLFNLVILGIIQLIAFLIPQDWQALNKMLNENGININLTPVLIKIMIIIQLIISLIFIVSGIGLLRGKNWARNLTIYFAFAICLLTLVSVLLSPSMVQQGILQIIYPGILILYFTNKNVEAHFKRNTNIHEST